MTNVRLIRHAAHTGNGTGWDLEEITIVAAGQPALPVIQGGPPFEYHHGFKDGAGDQFWVFVRKAPLSPGYCDRCQPKGEKS